MKCIEQLAKYKDIADLLYLTVHRLFTQELICELNKCLSEGWCLAKLGWQQSGDRFLFIYDPDRPLMGSYFQWRKVLLRGSSIYHICFKRRMVQLTGRQTSHNY